MKKITTLFSKENLGPLALAALTIFVCALVFLNAPRAHGSIATDTSAPTDKFRLYNLMASTTAESTIATTTTATSSNLTAYFDSSGRLVDGTVDLRGAKKVTFYFTRGGAAGPNVGTSTFSVQTSRDGTNWDSYAMLITNTTNTNSQTLTRVASVQLPASGPPATTTSQVFMDLTGAFLKARCIAVLQVDGDQACAASVQY